MLTEPLPIAIFVRTKTRHPTVRNITQEWRVEPTVVENIIITHFEDAGIYSVEPHLEKILFKKIIDIINNSPEIFKQLKRAEEIEAKRRKDRPT